MRCLKVLLLLVLLPSLVWAQGVLGPAANPPDKTLYDYRNSLAVQDEFLAGTSSGSIGTLGWAAAGGTLVQSPGTTSRPGLFTRTTSASINTLAYTNLNNTTANAIDPSSLYTQIFVLKLNQVDANTTLWAGMGASGQVSVPNDGIWFERRDADTNWQCVTRNTSSQTKTDTGIAASTSYITMKIQRTTSNVIFSLNGAVVCTHTATIPTVFLNPGWLLTNSAAADKTMTIDYYEMTMAGLSR